MGLLARRIDDRAFLDLATRLVEQGPPVYADPAVRASARLTPEWPPPGRGLTIGSSFSQ